jgi:hypothetical protein
MVLENDAETAMALFEMAQDSYHRSAPKWPVVDLPILANEIKTEIDQDFFAASPEPEQVSVVVPVD